MVNKRWKYSNTCVHNVAYHLIWCPKYRRKILIGSIAKDLRELLKLKAKELDIEIEIDDMMVMPDHVDLFVNANPTAAPHWILQQLKGYTSYQLREKYPELKSRIPTLWTRSYYCESIGQSVADRDVTEGNTDIPKEATPRTMETLELHELYSWEYVRSRIISISLYFEPPGWCI